MSRHKLVKNLNLDEELEDFEGGANYGDGGENGRQNSKNWPPSSTNQTAQISASKIKVRGQLRR